MSTEQMATEETSESTSGPVTSGGMPDVDTKDDQTTEDDAVPELPLDTVFEMLRNERRRRVLQYLNKNGGSSTLSDLAEHIAALENDTTVQALSSQERKRVYVGLYQCHLPKMDGAEVIDFDSDRGDVERAPPADQLDPYLEEAMEEDDDESAIGPGHYASIVAVGGVGYLTAAVLSAPAWVPTAVALGVVLASATVAVTALIDAD